MACWQHAEPHTTSPPNGPIHRVAIFKSRSVRRAEWGEGMREVGGLAPGARNLCWMLSLLITASMPPLSPQSCTRWGAGAGLRRLIGQKEACRKMRENIFSYLFQATWSAAHPPNRVQDNSPWHDCNGGGGREKGLSYRNVYICLNVSIHFTNWKENQVSRKKRWGTMLCLMGGNAVFVHPKFEHKSR